MSPECLGDRLLLLARKQHKTQKRAAEALGIDSGTLSSWISGKHEPRASDVVKLARHFGVSSDYLLGLSDERR